MTFWMDYTIEQGLNSFRVTGDWDKEVMGYGPDGEPGGKKGRPLYNPGEVYIVGEDGWLRKVDDLTNLIYKYRDKKG
jgi:hypothetical protein